MLIFLLVALAESYELTLRHAGVTYKIYVTDIGYVPYGQNISGSFTVMKDLCKPQTSKAIILTQFTKQCTYEEQFRNTETSLLTIFSFENLPQPLPQVTTNGIIILIPEEVVSQLKSSRNNTVNLIFSMDLKQLPDIQYIIHTLNQSTPVLKQIQQFINYEMNFRFTPIYYTKENKLEEKCGIDLTTDENGKVNWEYGCRIQGTFETTYEQLRYENDKVPYREMLYENLAQICIFQEYGLDKWLSYRISYIDNCYALFLTLQEIQQCNLILKELEHINQQKIQTCVTNSFTNNSITNTILSNHSKLQIDPELPPSKLGYVVINQQILAGDYRIEKEINGKHLSVIFSALCSSYLEAKPAICMTNLDVENPQSWAFITIICAIIIAGSFIYLIIRGVCKKSQEEIQQMMIQPERQVNDGLELNQVN